MIAIPTQFSRRPRLSKLPCAIGYLSHVAVWLPQPDDPSMEVAVANLSLVCPACELEDNQAWELHSLHSQLEFHLWNRYWCRSCLSQYEGRPACSDDLGESNQAKFAKNVVDPESPLYRPTEGVGEK